MMGETATCSRCNAPAATNADKVAGPPSIRRRRKPLSAKAAMMAAGLNVPSFACMTIDSTLGGRAPGWAWIARTGVPPSFRRRADGGNRKFGSMITRTGDFPSTSRTDRSGGLSCMTVPFPTTTASTRAPKTVQVADSLGAADAPGLAGWGRHPPVQGLPKLTDHKGGPAHALRHRRIEVPKGVAKRAILRASASPTGQIQQGRPGRERKFGIVHVLPQCALIYRGDLKVRTILAHPPKAKLE